MEAHELLERVNDERSFLVFARALTQDRVAAVAAERERPTLPRASDAGGWENATIERFLEAAIAWAEDSRFGEAQGMSSVSPWRKFAAFLYSGKIYE